MPSLTTAFASLLDTVSRPGDFFVSGKTTFFYPLLEVEGVGRISLPLPPAQAKQLIAASETAPFGRGAKTLIDPTVRRCKQIDASRIHLGGQHWMQAMETIIARVAEGFGIRDPITAELYKLLIYDRGSFFVDHRDTEKVPGMFGTLVITLPSTFTGGDLIVRHKDREARIDLSCEDPAEMAFAAFYADCVHEVLPITKGCRLTLAYNLVRRTRSRPLEVPDYETEQTRIAALLRSWHADQAETDDQADTHDENDEAPEKLIYPLEHAYTQAELHFSTLKGRDAAVAGVLTEAAEQANCDLRLALLTIEESGGAEHAEYYGSRRGHWSDASEEYEAGEVFERSVTLSHWRTARGKGITLGTIPGEEDEFSPPDACNGLTPDEEHFQEATGNAGASFERSYRRAALVLWPRDRTFAVLCQAGLQITLPYLDNLIHRWQERRQPSFLRQAHDLATHMLTRWPQRSWHSDSDEGVSDEEKMLTLLIRLDDDALIERFLTEITAAGVYRRADNKVILRALKRLSAEQRVELMAKIITDTHTTALKACADLLAHTAGAAGASDATGAPGAGASSANNAPRAAASSANGVPRAVASGAADSPRAGTSGANGAPKTGTSGANGAPRASATDATGVRPSGQADKLLTAATRLVDALPPNPPENDSSAGVQRQAWRRGSTIDPNIVADLLIGLSALNASLAERAVTHFLAQPQTYNLDAILVPALVKLTQSGGMPSGAASEQLRAACLAHLQRRIADPPIAPTNQRRSSALPCACPHCVELTRFLDDPERAIWTYRAVEFDRGHMENVIQRAKLDIDTTTNRQGRPYGLVCTKNRASYERRLKQHKEDLANAKILLET